MKRGKNYREVRKQIPETEVSLEEAVKLLPQMSKTKFDGSVELHAKLGIDPKQADQQVRTTVSLPNGTGKDVRVVAFCTEEKVKGAKGAGAIEAGLDNLVEKIKGGWMDFDTAVAEPAAMKSLGKIAKILGQKGLMPNPKAGTVGEDVVKLVNEIKQGKVEIRNDKGANVHVLCGKVGFGEGKLMENIKEVVRVIMEVKPASLKGVYIKGMYLKTTMSPSVKIDLNSLSS